MLDSGPIVSVAFLPPAVPRRTTCRAMRHSVVVVVVVVVGTWT